MPISAPDDNTFPKPDASGENRPPPARKKLHKRLGQVLRWSIFVVGVAWIVMQLTLLDRVHLVRPDGTVESKRLLQPARPGSIWFRMLDVFGMAAVSDGGTTPIEEATVYHVKGVAEPVPRSQLVSQPDRKSVRISVRKEDGTTGEVEVRLLGLRLHGKPNEAPVVDELVVQNPNGAGAIRVPPTDVAGGFKLQTPYPLVEPGMISMVREANLWLLAFSIAIFPLTIVITATRWNQILHSQDIHLPFRRVIVLNMVGNFYNSFFPGSTGGDFLKAYYVSRQTTHKIRAMLSVFADRVIGLLALVILGGSVSAFQYFNALDKGSPTAVACGRVAAVCALITVGTFFGGILLATRPIRAALGFDWLVGKLPMQHHLNKVREAGRLYIKNAPRVFWWIAITFPIHSTVVVSAILAGQAFGLNIAWPYYFVCVPVMVLVASLPISPQGAGVMEYFGFLLLAKQGATVSEVLALTLSIRFVQILWNLLGGIFVMRGDFAAVTKSYDAIADEDEEPEPTDIDATAAPRVPGTFVDKGNRT